MILNDLSTGQRILYLDTNHTKHECKNMLGIKNWKLLMGAVSCYGIYRLLKMMFSANAEIHEVLFSGADSMNCQSLEPNRCTKCSNGRCFFSNINRMIEIINASKKTVCLSMYILSNYDLTQAIIKAKARGVHVRVITDYKMFENNQCLEKLLRKGVQIRYKRNEDCIMHHKLCLIDTVPTNNEASRVHRGAILLPKTGIVMVGSQNWCLQALTVNYDNTLITTDKEIIKGLQAEFERMWIDFGSSGNFG